MVPGSFLGAIERAFAQADERTGLVTDDLAIGTGHVRLHRAGRALDRFALPAFRHLRSAAPALGPVDLEVYLWDSRSTGVFAPSPPWSERDFLARGEVRHVLEDDVQLCFRIDSGVLSLFDARHRRAYCWVRDPALLPPWEYAAPLRPILGWWASSRGAQLAHGAAVGTAAGAVLLAARGGSGKSTTALSAIEHGLHYLGDDYVMIEPSANHYRVASLYCTAKVTPANLGERLPRLAALAQGETDHTQDKITLGLDARFGAQLVPTLPLQAILVPQVSGQPTPSLERLSGAAVLAALAPTTVLQLPGANGEWLARMGEVTATLPGYRLNLGTDLAANVALIRSLIGSLVEQPPAERP